MSDFYYVDKPDDLPTNREYYIELNKKLKEYGLPELIVTDRFVFKDKIHEFLGIGIELDEEQA